MNLKLTKGFTLIELIIVIVIASVLSTIILSTFINFRKNQALQRDAELIVQVLRQARNQTLSSKNSSVYGVHLTTTQVTLFTGPTYSSSDPNNLNYSLNSVDNVLTVSLTGGGSNVVFQRLTGETAQYGEIIISSPSISLTKSVTIYKTGLVESE